MPVRRKKEIILLYAAFDNFKKEKYDPCIRIAYQIGNPQNLYRRVASRAVVPQINKCTWRLLRQLASRSLEFEWVISADLGSSESLQDISCRAKRGSGISLINRRVKNPLHIKACQRTYFSSNRIPN